MNTDSVLRHLMSDEESLQQYSTGEAPDYEDVQRRMFLRERAGNRLLPDHHYRLLLEISFDGLNTFSEIFTKGLPQLATGLLTLAGNRIFVREKQQHQWQETITSLSPLLLKSLVLQRKGSPNWKDRKAVIHYYNEFVLPEFRYTALASPSIKPLDELFSNNNGFHDLHMHLNGSTETDVAWQDYLTYPGNVLDELKAPWRNERVRELLEQESSLLEPFKFHNQLKIARRLRHFLFDLIHNPAKGVSAERIEDLLVKIRNLNKVIPQDNPRNPFLVLVADDENDTVKIAVEALMVIRVTDHISDFPDSHCVLLFHYYLLILGLCNRLLVQQTHQYGFEQFQKLTISGLREFSEAHYTARFHQIQGNELRNLRRLEGRFSPKETDTKLANMIYNISKGWQHMIDKKHLDDPGSAAMPELTLVAHFIKRAEGKEIDPLIRHRWLRNDLWHRAKVLSLHLKNNPKTRNLVVGIDAASSEFDAPPEVFAPAFRKLRRDQIKHFTYHAGEDFHHLVSGLRAIFEAIEFTEMQPGDRIGHAVATGLSSELWLTAVGEELLIRRGEWLDNLLFVLYLIDHSGDVRLSYLRKNLLSEIKEHAAYIYGFSPAVQQLIDAWLYRKYEPMLALQDSREDAESLSVFDYREWNDIINAKIDGKVTELIRKYHNDVHRHKYDEIISIVPDGLLSRRALEICQQIILQIMSARGIIIETLPTSNVRIGHHRNYKTYHLWNWLYLKKKRGDVPAIVLGTDDTGIFATNILNEYANVYVHLSQKQSDAFAIRTIIELEENSARFRFTS